MTYTLSQQGLRAFVELLNKAELRKLISLANERLQCLEHTEMSLRSQDQRDSKP
jgi:hypothetical protein